jgi:hypothetical protein
MDLDRARRAIRPEPTTRWECNTCLLDTGRTSNVSTKVRVGGQVRVLTGKLIGGTFFEVCALCLARGKTTIINEA